MEYKSNSGVLKQALKPKFKGSTKNHSFNRVYIHVFKVGRLSNPTLCPHYCEHWPQPLLASLVVFLFLPPVLCFPPRRGALPSAAVPRDPVAPPTTGNRPNHPSPGASIIASLISRRRSKRQGHGCGWGDGERRENECPVGLSHRCQFFEFEGLDLRPPTIDALTSLEFSPESYKIN